MTHIVHRSLKNRPPVARRAEGVYIYDETGKQYLDACGGAAVSCLGHGHPDVVEAMTSQLRTLAYAHTGFFTSDVAEELADQLVANAPSGLDHVYFVSGGSEAMEAALKLARQYFVEIGQPQRTTFIARRQSYHGNTLGALAVGGNEARRRQFAPLLIETGRVSACFEYRGRADGESQAQYTQRLLRELEDKVLEIGPDKVIGFCAETVVGATTGAVPPTPGYLKGVREICDRYGMLYIADEVMCGMGRTGTLHAVEQEDVVPDLLAIAKGLGGGYQPIGALLIAGRMVDSLRRGSGLFQHGHTYLGHPTACAAALAVQKVIQRDRLLPQVRARGDYLRNALERRFGEHPHVGDIRGRGLFLGVELVQDRASKKPFEPGLQLHARLKARAMANGLMIYPMGGTIDGQAGDHFLIAPPFIVTPEQLDEAVERLTRSLDEALQSLPAHA
ncbi:MAG: aspartate aminotransferase family protein [Lautropia sp.]